MSDFLKNVLSGYEQTQVSDFTDGFDFDEKNYFSTMLPKGVKSESKNIRILPIKGKEGDIFWEEMYAHSIKVDGKWRKFACLEHSKEEDCPFCETYRALKAKGTEQADEDAKKYKAKRFYVLRVIERGKEEEGVKFWRFGHNYKQQGVLDKLVNVLKKVGHDITNPETGRDVSIDIALDYTLNKNTPIPMVQSITYPLETSVLGTKEQMEEWLNDERTWEDLYPIKSYDYLAIIAKGGIPKWSKTLEKFVDSSELEDEENGVENEYQSEKNAIEKELTMGTESSNSDVDYEEDSDDDLPF